MNYSLLNDNQLLVLMKDKDDGNAFREIYDRHWKDVFLVAVKKVNNKELAEGFTQNIFVSLWEKRATQQIEKIRPWLLGSLKYSIINYYKSQLVHEKYVNYQQQHSRDAIPATEHLVALKDLSEALENGLELLPEKTQTIFRMSRVESRSVKEISQQLNITEKAVEYHITQSLKLLRTHLKDYLVIFWLFVLNIF